MLREPKKIEFFPLETLDSRRKSHSIAITQRERSLDIFETTRTLSL